MIFYITSNNFKVITKHIKTGKLPFKIIKYLQKNNF